MAYASVDTDGFTVESNTASADALRAEFAPVADDLVVETTTDGETALADDTPDVGEKPAPKADASAERNPDGTFKAKPKKGSLDRLIWEREEAERKASAAEAKAVALEAQLAQHVQSKAAPVTEAPKAFASFEDWSKGTPDGSYEDYLDARAEWRWEQKETQRATAERDAKERDAFDAAATQFRTAEQALKVTHPDYDAVLARGAQLMRAGGVAAMPEVMVRAIATSPRGPELLWDLASHHADLIQLAQEFQNFPATAAPLMRRLLEARLPAAPIGSAETPKPVISQAKPPIKPMGSAPSGTDEPNDDPDDLDAFVRVNNDRDAKRRR